MPSFEEFGLRVELVQALEDLEISSPTGIQEAVIPALRRGGNLVARASSGSGKTLAYVLGILDRLNQADADDDEPASTRLLILVPDTSDAERAAVEAAAFAHAIDHQVAVLGTGWRTPPSEAAILIGSPEGVVESIRSSTVKLDKLQAVVVDGASTIVELGGWMQVEEVLDLVPRDSQRVIVSPSFPPQVEDVIERRVKRALRYPAEPAIPQAASSGPKAGRISYVIASEREKLDLLAMQLRGREPNSAAPIIFCRSDERAAFLAEHLSVRGFLVGEPADDEVDVVIAAAGTTLAEINDDVDGETGQPISFDVPADESSLRARHSDDHDSVVLVLPRELAHVREIARLANFEARSTPIPSRATAAQAELKGFRDEIRAALRQEDLTAQMLVLEPLLDEYTSTEVAAALAAMLRLRRGRSGPNTEAANTGHSGPSGSERMTKAGPPPVTWARLFVGLGTRDEIRPGDLVGALAGEANIAASRLGKIEIRDSFSIVEVQADIADQVIQAVNGITLKGRSVRVDYDRGGPAKRPSGPGGPARRTTRKPPSQ